MTGAELRRKRKKLQLSQTELAQAWGVTKQAIYNWENDRSPIKPMLDWAIKGLEHARNV